MMLSRLHLAEGHLGLVAILCVQLMRHLHSLAHSSLVHQFHLSIVWEGVPVDDAFPDSILHSLSSQELSYQTSSLQSHPHQSHMLQS